VGNLIVAALAFLIQTVLPRKDAPARLLAMLVTAFSLFWEAGYVIYAMILNKGDWMIAARDLIGGIPIYWRTGGVVLGVGLYALGARLIPWAAHFGPVQRATRLLRLSWVSGLVSAVVAAGFYTPDHEAIREAALELGAASWPLLLTPNGAVIPQSEPIGRSPTWIISCLTLYGLFIATLGRGLPW
jgi:hypothetical protein